MRSFIAIDLPAGLKSSISGVTHSVSGSSWGIRWVPVENMHLTLKFLGEIKDDLIAAIEMKLMVICGRYQPLAIDIKGVGAFPNLRNPNVLWVGIGPSERLAALFAEIDAGLSEMGFERESRRFSPHLTIGRVKDRRDIDSVIKELATYKYTFFGTIEVREILLMESVLKPSGAEYSKVAVIKLNSE